MIFGTIFDYKTNGCSVKRWKQIVKIFVTNRKKNVTKNEYVCNTAV